MSEKRYKLVCSYLHVHRGAHFQHQVDDNHRYYDNAFTWVDSSYRTLYGCRSMAFSSTRVFFKFIFTEEKGHVSQSQITTKKPTGDREIGIQHLE